MPEKSVLILMLNLCIRNRSLAYRTPVDDPGAFVDIAFFIKLDKTSCTALEQPSSMVKRSRSQSQEAPSFFN